MAELYGKEVAAALDSMAQYDREEQVCRRCERRCCLAAHCELYAPHFSRCPIHELRPLVCRLHFCDKFPIAASPVMRELDDIFFDSLLAAERAVTPQVRFFDSPPLIRVAPDLVAATGPIMTAVRDGALLPAEAEKLIRREAEKYKTANYKSESLNRHL